MTKKLIFGKSNLNNSKNSGKNILVKTSKFQSTKNSKNFNYHERLPFRFASIELKYIRNIVAFLGVTVTLLLILQNLTAYSSNFDPKIQTVRLITNFNNQQKSQSQKNIVQEFSNSQNNPIVTNSDEEDLENAETTKNINEENTEKKNSNPKSNSKNQKSVAKSSQQSQKMRIKKNQRISTENTVSKSNSQQENYPQNSTEIKDKK